MYGQWLDIGIMLVIVLSMLSGVFRGFIKELVAIGVWIAAFWFAIHYVHNLDPYVSPYIQDPSIRLVAEYIIILISFIVLGSIVNLILGLVLTTTGLGGIDRLLGAGFGFLKGVLIISLILLGLKMTPFPFQKYFGDSKMTVQFNPVVSWLEGYVPTVIQKVKQYDPTHGLSFNDIVGDL